MSLPTDKEVLGLIPGSAVRISSTLYRSPNIVRVMKSRPFVGSCHHGMARPLGCGWGSRPPDMDVSCEYIK
jgi:hypothetical protein